MSSSSTNTERLIGVDTGGAFIDLAYQDGKSRRVFKLLSSPDNPAQAVLDGLWEAAPQGGRQIVHAATVATNAILSARERARHLRPRRTGECSNHWPAGPARHCMSSCRP